MDRIERYFLYMKFKSKLKHIPVISPTIRIAKWRVYRPIYIKLWHLWRHSIYTIKRKGLIGWNENEVRFKKLRNSHKGEIAFIVGNGPSLQAKDLDVIYTKGYYCFGSNRINLIFNQSKWRPNCYLAFDKQIYRNNDPTISEMLKTEIDLYALGKDVYQCVPYEKRKNNMVYFEVKPNSYYLKVDEFSNDALEFIVDGFTITYAAMQLAYYMGFKEVYLLGVDCNYGKQTESNGHVKDTGNSSTYFSNKYDPQNKNVAYVKGMMEAYETAKSFADNTNFKIYNATRGGKLEVFKRINLDNLLASI